VTARRGESPGRRLAVRRSHAAPAGRRSVNALLGDLLAHLRSVRVAVGRRLPYPPEAVDQARDLLLEAEHEVERFRRSGQLTEVDAAVVVMVCLDATEAVLRVAASAHRRTGSRHTSAGVN